MSAGVNRLKTSSVDSGSSQNYATVSERIGTMGSYDRDRQTLAQYGSPAGMSFSSDRRKIPCLKTSFDSEAPIASIGNDHRIIGLMQWRKGKGDKDGVA